MRTTVDLPADLVRAAKTRAAESGEKLKDLFTRAVAHEVGQPAGRHGGSRVELPLVGVGARPEVSLTNADLAAILAEEDAEKHGGR